MVGVLIVAGIVFYGMIYSGVSQLGVVPSIPPMTTLEALRPKTATAKDFPKPTGVRPKPQPRVGRKT